MITPNLEVVGSAHRARFGEDFDAVLADVITRCHDAAVATDQLGELALLNVLAVFAAGGQWDPGDRDSAAKSQMADGLLVSAANSAVRHH